MGLFFYVYFCTNFIIIMIIIIIMKQSDGLNIDAVCFSTSQNELKLQSPNLAHMILRHCGNAVCLG